MNNKKKITMLLLTATAIGAYAQGNGMAGINEATKMVTSYFDPGTKLIYAIGAVVGLIGGIKVYNKFSSGDPDTSKTAASWFGACIFLIVAATMRKIHAPNQEAAVLLVSGSPLENLLYTLMPPINPTTAPTA